MKCTHAHKIEIYIATESVILALDSFESVYFQYWGHQEIITKHDLATLFSHDAGYQ